MSKLPCANTMIFKKYPPLKSGPPEISVIQREFRRNEGTTDYATIPEVTLTGDFVIEFDSLGGIDTYGRLLGNTASFDNELRLNNNNTSLSMKFSGGVSRTINFDTVIDRNEFNRFKISRVSNVVTLTINGTIQSGTITDAAPLVLDVMHKSDITYNSGILANLKIYDNGTLVRNYPINDGKNILANVATALGSEVDGLAYALTTAIGGVASVVLTSLSVIGKTYLVEVSYSGVVGDASVRIGGFSGPSFTGTGSHSFVATAITTVNDILGALTGVTSGSVTVSIKEAAGYGTIINGNADDWGLFDRQANGDWLGQELVVNGGFDSDSGWTLGGGASISGGTGNFSGVPNEVMLQIAPISVGANYKVDWEIITGGPGVVWSTSGAWGSQTMNSSDIGSYSEYYDAVGSSVRIASSAQAVSPVSIDNVSVKEVLKNA